MSYVFVHGFLGLPSSWDEVIEAGRWSGPIERATLLGHGLTSDWSRTPRTFDEEVDRLAASARASVGGPAHWVGYSMGARVALVLAARHPELVSRLTLVSGSAGLPTDDERRERALADDALAHELEIEGLPSFVQRWEQLPLFASQQRLPPTERAKHRLRRLAHRERSVSRALTVLTPGRMPVVTGALSSIDVPVSLVAGALDTKYAQIARALMPLFPRARVHVLEDAGHDLCLERPREIAALITEIHA
jgi:2-succinyl-6-hydroxy-2,4-cyclohexadiene-1-carboxylate synthase